MTHWTQYLAIAISGWRDAFTRGIWAANTLRLAHQMSVSMRRHDGQREPIVVEVE